jgi:branched-chain amino acid transport system substrate-binding protein
MFKMRRTSAAVAIAAAFVVAAFAGLAGSASGNATASASKAPLQVPVLGVDSGPYQIIGTSQTHGVQLAINQINAAGGVLGRKLVPVFRDDAADPATAVSLARSLIQQLKSPVFFGSSLSTTSDAIEPIVNAAKVIMFPGSGDSNTVNAKLYPYIFRAYLTEVSQGEALIPYLKGHHITNIAIAYDNSSGYGIASEAEAVHSLDAGNINVTTVQSFIGGTADLTPQALAIKASNPQVVFVIGSAIGDFSDFANDAASIGLTVPMIGSPAIFSSQFTQLAGANGASAVGEVYKTQTYTSTGPSDPAIVSFISKINALGGQSDLLVADMYWYDMVHLWAYAVEKTKSFNPTKVKTELESIRGYHGIQGTFNFSPTQHDGLAPNALVIAHVGGSSFENGLWLLAPNN